MKKNISHNKIKHGTLIQFQGLGVLLTGKSGIGKSECALELISQGALFICDDAPTFHYQIDNNKSQLIGTCPDNFQHQLFIRQLGILNIVGLYGNATTLTETPLDLVIHLYDEDEIDKMMANENSKNNIDNFQQSAFNSQNLSPHYQHLKIEDITIYQLSLAVSPQRNIPLLVKTAIQQFIMTKIDSSSTILLS